MTNLDYVCERDFFETRRANGETFEWKRINRCQAWYYHDTNTDLVWIKSYNTIVAVYDVYAGVLVSLGRYSMTTYQHIRKFRNDYAPVFTSFIHAGWEVDEINLELTNWFK